MLCGVHVPHAALTLQSGVLCASCALSFQGRGECEVCGKEAIMLARSPSRGIMVRACSVCRKKRNINCATCGKNRAPAGIRASDGKPLCKACNARDGRPWICPTCGNAGKPHSAQQCENCYWSKHLEKRVRSVLPLIQRPWLRAVYAGFHREMATQRSAKFSCLRIDTYLPVVMVIDSEFDSPNDVTSPRLLKRFSMDVIRSHAAFFDYCAKVNLFPSVTTAVLRRDAIDGAAARSVQRCETEWYGSLIKDLHAKLMAVRNRAADRGWLGEQRMRPRTVKSTINAAVMFFEHATRAGATSVLSVIQEHIDTFLLEYPGYRASLSAALTRIRRDFRSFRRLRVPYAKPTIRPGLVLPYSRINEILNECLERADRPSQSLLLVVLLLTFPVPPSRLVRLRLTDLQRSASGTFSIRFHKLDVQCPPRYSALIDRYLAERRTSTVIPADDAGWLFPGRHPGEHLDSTSVRLHLSKFGITSRQAFASAISTLYLEGVRHPSAVARAFGVTTTTAVKYFAQFDDFSRSALYQRFEQVRAQRGDRPSINGTA